MPKPRLVPQQQVGTDALAGIAFSAHDFPGSWFRRSALRAGATGGSTTESGSITARTERLPHPLHVPLSVVTARPDAAIIPWIIARLPAAGVSGKHEQAVPRDVSERVQPARTHDLAPFPLACPTLSFQ